MKQATIVLTVEERAFINETKALVLKGYTRTVTFYGKYDSNHSKNIVIAAQGAYDELSDMSGKTRKQQQNILIKHLGIRAQFLIGYEDKKDDGKTNRCTVVGEKIIDINKKLRSIKKLEGKKA